MPGSHIKPRTQVSLPQEIHNMYQKFAEITNKPRAKVLTAILIESAPIYQNILDALDASNNDAEAFKKEIRDRLLLKTSDALQQTLDL